MNTLYKEACMNTFLSILYNEVYCDLGIFMENYGNDLEKLRNEIKDKNENEIRNFINSYV